MGAPHRLFASVVLTGIGLAGCYESHGVVVVARSDAGAPDAGVDGGIDGGRRADAGSCEARGCGPCDGREMCSDCPIACIL